jgi:hypothetical protein
MIISPSAVVRSGFEPAGPDLRVPADRDHQFRRMVITDSGPS